MKIRKDLIGKPKTKSEESTLRSVEKKSPSKPYEAETEPA